MRLLSILPLLAAAALPALGAPDDASRYLQAYPPAIPPDTSFSTVVSSQPFPAMKYAVPVIGWKYHPEETHVTPTGALVMPRPGSPAGLYLAPLISVAPAAVPAVLDMDRVSRRLVDGYLPGVASKWSCEGIDITQLAFCTLLEGTEVRTGNEPLVAFSRYTLSNPSGQAKQVSFWLNFGEACRGMSMRVPPLSYGRRLAFDGRSVTEPGGSVAARLLSTGLDAAFHPIAIAEAAAASRYTTINAAEAALPGAYDIPVTREGDAVTVNGWTAAAGADLHLEASLSHGLPVAVEVTFQRPDGSSIPGGWLYRTGLFPDRRPASECLYRGQHSVPVPWSSLAGVVPQGRSTMRLKSFYPVGDALAPCGTWEPIVYFSEPGAVPAFKRAGDGAPTENSLEIRVNLKPGASVPVDIAVPYYPVPAGSAAALAASSLDARLAAFRAWWSRELNRAAQFVVPEPRIRDSYRMCLANNLMLVDRDPASGLLLPHPDPTAYEAVWAGDSGVIVEAMDRLGYHEEAAAWLDYFLAKQGTRKPDGEATDFKGFYTGDALRWMSENGFILWAMAEHYHLTGNKAWLKSVSRSMIASADWIIRQRNTTKVMVNGRRPRHYGLLPKGAPSDIGTWDYWYWTDTYSYMGLNRAALALREIGMASEARRLAAEAADYRRCILQSVNGSLNRSVKPPFVPPSPYTNGTPTADSLNGAWYSICSPIYMVEAGLYDARSAEAGWVLYWLEKFVLYSGLPAFGGGSIDPHYVYNQALAQLLRGETDKFVWTFYSLFAYGQSRDTYSTIEGQNIVMGNLGDTWDAYRQPHMHSNSRVLDMVRIALVLEDGPRLHLMAGTPRGWLADGKIVQARRAPTTFGDVSFTATSRIAVGRVRVVIDPPTRIPARIVLHLRPPAGRGALASVRVGGKPWKRFGGEKIDLGVLPARTVVDCAYERQRAKPAIRR